MIVTYSFFVFHWYKTKCPISRQNFTTTSSLLDEDEKIMPNYMKIVWYLLFTMIFVFMTKELLQLFSSPKSYFKIVENYIQIIFITLALITIMPERLGPINLDGHLCECLHTLEHIYYNTAAVLNTSNKSC